MLNKKCKLKIFCLYANCPGTKGTTLFSTAITGFYMIFRMLWVCKTFVHFVLNNHLCGITFAFAWPHPYDKFWSNHSSLTRNFASSASFLNVPPHQVTLRFGSRLLTLLLPLSFADMSSSDASLFTSFSSSENVTFFIIFGESVCTWTSLIRDSSSSWTSNSTKCNTRKSRKKQILSLGYYNNLRFV